MTTLPEALRQTPRPLLLFIGRQRSLSYSSNLTKVELLDRLQSTLGDPANLQTALAPLAGPEREILTTLLGLAGRLAERYLSPRYGQIRPLRLLPKISQTETASLSPLEHLLTLGLIFLHQPTHEIFIPADLREPISEWLEQRMANERTNESAKQPRSVANGESANWRTKHDEQPFLIPHSPFLIRHSPFLIRHSSFATRSALSRPGLPVGAAASGRRPTPARALAASRYPASVGPSLRHYPRLPPRPQRTANQPPLVGQAQGRAPTPNII